MMTHKQTFARPSLLPNIGRSFISALSRRLASGSSHECLNRPLLPGRHRNASCFSGGCDGEDSARLFSHM